LLYYLIFDWDFFLNKMTLFVAQLKELSRRKKQHTTTLGLNYLC
jgi:hypothetical protein